MTRLYVLTLLVVSLFTGSSTAQDTLEGTWTARQSDNGYRLVLSLEGLGWHSSNSLYVPALPPDEFDMDLDRDAGRLHLEGVRKGARAAGFFRFTPDPEFNRAIASLGYDRFDTKQLFFLTTLDARISEIGRLPGLGYDRLTTDELFSMHIHGAMADHIVAMKELGFDRLSVEELLSLRIHDVTPEFVRAIRVAGYRDATLEDLLSMRIHDVTPEYVRTMNKHLSK